MHTASIFVLCANKSLQVAVTHFGTLGSLFYLANYLVHLPVNAHNTGAVFSRGFRSIGVGPYL